jgi:hypothetical protein
LIGGNLACPWNYLNLCTLFLFKEKLPWIWLCTSYKWDNIFTPHIFKDVCLPKSLETYRILPPEQSVDKISVHDNEDKMSLLSTRQACLHSFIKCLCSLNSDFFPVMQLIPCANDSLPCYKQHSRDWHKMLTFWLLLFVQLCFWPVFC